MGVIRLEPACFIEPEVEEREVVEIGWWEENVTNSALVTRIRKGSIALKIVLIVTAVLLVLLIVLICVVWQLKKRTDGNRKDREAIEME